VRVFVQVWNTLDFNVGFMIVYEELAGDEKYLQVKSKLNVFKDEIVLCNESINYKYGL